MGSDRYRGGRHTGARSRARQEIGSRGRDRGPHGAAFRRGAGGFGGSSGGGPGGPHGGPSSGTKILVWLSPIVFLNAFITSLSVFLSGVLVSFLPLNVAWANATDAFLRTVETWQFALASGSAIKSGVVLLSTSVTPVLVGGDLLGYWDILGAASHGLDMIQIALNDLGGPVANAGQDSMTLKEKHRNPFAYE